MRRGDHRAHDRIRRGIVGEAETVVPAHDASGLQDTTCAQGLFADEQTRAEAEAAGKPVGLRCQHRPNVERRGADRDAGAGLEVEPCEQRRVDSGAKCSVSVFQRLRERLLWIERHRTVERIAGIDRLDLDQCRAPVLRARHGAHGGGERYTASVLQKCALIGIGFAQTESERQVAAEDDAAFAFEPLGEPGCERAHSGHRHDAKRDAGDKHVESAQAGPQFACSEAQRQ